MHNTTEATLTALRARDHDPAFADAPIIDAYARISVNRNTGEHEKTDRQIEDILNAIHSRKARLGIIHRDDNFSAWRLSARRPGWVALTKRLATGKANGVAIWRTDRLLRQPRDLEFLIDRATEGTKVLATDGEHDLSDSSDRFTLRILTAAACRESDSNSARSKRKQAAMRKAGIMHGGIRPFGEMPGPDGEKVSPEQVEAERQAIRYAYDQFRAGVLLSKVAEEWTRRGFRTRGRAGRLRADGTRSEGQQGPMSYDRVRAILLQPRIAGLVVDPDGTRHIRSNYVPILTESEYDWVVAKFAAAKRGRPPVAKAPLTLGVLTCGECGGNLSSKRNKRSGYYQDQYVCSPSAGCGRITVDAKAVEAVVREAVINRLASADHSELAVKYRQRYLDAKAREELAQATLNDIAVRFSRKEITMDQLLIIQPRLKEDLEAAQRAVEEAGHNDTIVGLVGGVVTREISELATEWDDADNDGKRDMARKARLTIVVHRASGCRQPASDRVTITPKG